MKGLTLAKEYYETYGKPMLETDFPELKGKIATGLIGAGSECFGYDDETSEDHDFEPGFQIFLPGEDAVDRQTAFRLERAYAKLPKEFQGYRRQAMSPVGGNRHGVIRLDEFLAEKTGRTDGILTTEDWLKLPEESLLEVANGALFWDGEGKLTALRGAILNPPQDMLLKKLAGCLLLMAQSGQYNYNRCLAHKETAAAQLAAFEFAKNALHGALLLAGKLMPYYKWQFRALRETVEEAGGIYCEAFADLAEDLEGLLTSPNDGDYAESKYFVMEGIASQFIDVLQDKEITKATCGDLEKHAYSVNDHIQDPDIRNLHILVAIQ